MLSFRQLRRAAVLLQAQQRMRAARTSYVQVLHAAVLIQRRMHGWSVRRLMAQQHAAATCVQVPLLSTC